jgi:hypothetical protein
LPYDLFTGQLLGPVALTAGLIIVLLAKLQGYWFTKAEYLREVRRANRQEQRADRLVVALLKLQGATEAMVTAVTDGQNRPEENAEWP